MVVTFRHCQCWTPLILKDIQTYATIRIDIWMVYSCDEGNLWWLERIICGEVNIQEENSSGIWTIVLYKLTLIVDCIILVP